MPGGCGAETTFYDRGTQNIIVPANQGTIWVY